MNKYGQKVINPWKNPELTRLNNWIWHRNWNFFVLFVWFCLNNYYSLHFPYFTEHPLKRRASRRARAGSVRRQSTKSRRQSSVRSGSQSSTCGTFSRRPNGGLSQRRLLLDRKSSEVLDSKGTIHKPCGLYFGTFPLPTFLSPQLGPLLSHFWFIFGPLWPIIVYFDLDPYYVHIFVHYFIHTYFVRFFVAYLV